MSYKFKVSESFAEGLGRISAEQTDRVRACLQPDQDVHKGVHEARKSLKRLRALLALYQAGLEDEDYRHLDHCYRDIARELSGTREIQAMLDSLLHLETRFGRVGRNRLLVALRKQFEGNRTQVISNRPAACQSNRDFEQSLANAGKQLTGLRLANDDFEAIRPGLEKTYRAARHWHKRAFEEGSGESFHEWRKTLQRHWRHMQLLTPAWPLELRARAIFLRGITETVGQDHDLTVLDDYLEKTGRTLGTAAQVRACRSLCRQRQEELRAAVRVDCEKLFAEGASAFAKRVGRYWQIACLERDGTSRSLEAANVV